MAPKILIIEDEKEIRENISKIFELSEYIVYSADNGKTGLLNAKQNNPDIIICDVMMPEMDGITFLNMLHNDPEMSSIPVIFLTASKSESDIKEGLKYGADIFINKPFDIDDLISAVENRIQKRRQNIKIYEEKINILQSNLSKSLPHEIRTPMNAILGYSDFLIKNYKILDEFDRLDIYKEINNSGKRLQRILDNFLTFANLNNLLNSKDEVIKYRAMQIDNIDLSIEEIVKFKLYEFGRLDDLEIQLVEGNVVINEIFLSKLLEELIDNCIKFSDTGDKISVTSWISDGIYNIIIYDEGIGLTDNQLKMIDAYIQFDRNTLEQQGTGLGLAIVKRIIDLFDGDISIDSIKGEFTRIHITLKCAL